MICKVIKKKNVEVNSNLDDLNFLNTKISSEVAIRYPSINLAIKNIQFKDLSVLPVSVTEINKPSKKKNHLSIVNTSTQLPPPLSHLNNNSENINNGISNKALPKKALTKKVIEKKDDNKDLAHIGYWQTVYSIESKQGKLLYRPRNKSKNCDYTRSACGHHQLTVQALRDIGCKSMQCRKDRLDYKKSLKLSKKLLALNEKRLLKYGITKLKGYQKYLIHQQGAYGIKNIIIADQGKKVLSENIIKNMANNSPFTFRELNLMSSKLAANKFLQHWEKKWVNEKRLIAGIKPKSTDDLLNAVFIPTFSDSELNLALNYKF